MKEKLYIETPIFRSHRIKETQNKNVFYKMECYQPVGSFKIRGMEALCRHYIGKGERKFIASSGGNGGYSLAYVGQQLGAEIKVVVPETTTEFMVNKIQNVGAEVEVFGKVWDEAHEYALQLAENSGAIYAPPFDHPLLWQGHSSIVDECAETMGQPDKIVVSVGGGGLLCGIFEGLKRHGWETTKVIAVETEGAAAFSKSFEAKRIVQLDKVDTVATSLGTKAVAAASIEMAKDFEVTPFIVTDEDAVGACGEFLAEYNVLVEPACGAALSYVYDTSEEIESDEKVLVIACGGVNMSLEKYLQLKKQLKTNEGITGEI